MRYKGRCFMALIGWAQHKQCRGDERSIKFGWGAVSSCEYHEVGTRRRLYGGAR